MRLRAALFVAVLHATSQAAAPPTTSCNELSGCIEERSQSHDLGRGAVITLPPGWTFFSYPMPQIGEFPLRQARAAKNGLSVAVTPVPNISHEKMSEPTVRGYVLSSAGKNVERSKEREVHYESFSRGGMVGGMASFTSPAADANPFWVPGLVLANSTAGQPESRYASVTTMVFSYNLTLFFVSVASEREPDKEYWRAVEAFRNVALRPAPVTPIPADSFVDGMSADRTATRILSYYDVLVGDEYRMYFSFLPSAPLTYVDWTADKVRKELVPLLDAHACRSKRQASPGDTMDWTEYRKNGGALSVRIQHSNDPGYKVEVFVSSKAQMCV